MWCQFLIATTESGKVLCFSLVSGNCDHTIDVTNVPITCLSLTEDENTQMFVGSFDLNLRIYNFKDRSLKSLEHIEDSIQCMESKWDYLFMGCVRGSLLRYSLKVG